MKINKIMGTHIELTEAIRSYAEQKISSLGKFTAHFEPAAFCDIEVGKITEGQKKGQVYRSEVNLQIPGELLRAEAVAEDLYAAIDITRAELKRQLIDRQKKIRAKKRKGWKILSTFKRFRASEE